MTSAEYLSTFAAAMEPFAPLAVALMAYVLGLSAVRLIIGAVKSAVRP